MHSTFKWIFVYCKCYISIRLMFLKKLMLIKQVHQKSETFFDVGISKIIVWNFNQMSERDVMIY